MSSFDVWIDSGVRDKAEDCQLQVTGRTAILLAKARTETLLLTVRANGCFKCCQ